MLDHDDLLAIFDAAIATDLPMHRMALVDHLGPERFHIPDSPNRATQLLADLQYLHRTHDAARKLAGWLRLASSLTTHRPAERAVFEWGLRRLDTSAPSADGASAPGDGRQGDGATTLLVLFANPLDGTRLQISEELRELDVGLQAHGGRLRREVAFEPRLADLPGALARARPSHLHFAGHGSTTRGLHLAKTPGAPASIGGRELADLLRLASPGDLDLITLSACQTRGLAEDLLTVSRAVVCVDGDLPDGAAPIFARALYEGLARYDVREAFGAGLASLRAHQRADDAERFRFFVRGAP